MTCKGFVVAMRAQVARVPFDRPFLCEDPADADWLIVSRWGGHAEYLTISQAADQRADAAAATDPAEEPAPLGLHPRRTWFGVLTPEGSGGESVFLLNRCLPKDLPVAGRFAPAEGFARLTTAADGTLRLLAVARELAEPAGEAAPAGALVVPPRPAARPQPCATAEAPAQAWMLTAERRPWAGEFLDGPCRPDAPA